MNKNKTIETIKYLSFFLIVILVCIYFYLEVPLIDDALIIQRYIINFKEGNGLIFNVGESYYGYTSIIPTWFNSLLGFFFDINLNLARFILPSLFLILIFHILYKFVFNKKIIPTMLALFNPIFIYYLYSGLESYFIFLFCLSYAYFLYKKNWKFSLFLTTIAPFFRPELIIIAAPLYILSITKLNEGKAKFFIASMVVPLSIILILFFYYENIVPLSILAKMQNSIDFIKFLKIFVISSLGMLDNKYILFISYFLTLITSSAAIYLVIRQKNYLLIYTILFILVYGLYLLISRAHYAWYFSPISLLISILLVYLIFSQKFLSMFFLSSVFVLFLFSQFSIVKKRNDYVKYFYIDLMDSISEKIISYEQPGRTVLVGSSGYIGVNLIDYKIRDWIGLDNPQIINLRKGKDKDNDNNIFCSQHWDIIVIRFDPNRFNCHEIITSDMIYDEMYGYFYILQK